MKSPFLKSLLSTCGVVVIVYVALLLTMERTRMIEKVMGANFAWWELVLIAAFLVSRLFTYLVVPSALAAVLVHVLTRRLTAGK